MSAKKYLTTSMLVLILTSISPVFSQNDVSNDTDLVTSNEKNPQFLIRTEHNGRVKYVACATQNLYFHRATASTPDDEASKKDHEFTAKGASETQDDYFGYIFFLVQDTLIIACNESGDFNGQPEGLYNLSRFSYPLSISPESFEGKNFKTVDNHPLFEKDPSMHKLTIRLLEPEKEDPVLSTEPVDASEENIFGQVQIDFPSND